MGEVEKHTKKLKKNVHTRQYDNNNYDNVILWTRCSSLNVMFTNTVAMTALTYFICREMVAKLGI